MRSVILSSISRTAFFSRRQLRRYSAGRSTSFHTRGTRLLVLQSTYYNRVRNPVLCISGCDSHTGTLWFRPIPTPRKCKRRVEGDIPVGLLHHERKFSPSIGMAPNSRSCEIGISLEISHAFLHDPYCHAYSAAGALTHPTCELGLYALPRHDTTRTNGE